MNVLIIGMENAIFLAHPYRRNQEGIEVFLRTILTFTGKGVLFALGLVAVLAWAWAAISIGKQFSSQWIGAGLFAAGILAILTSLASAIRPTGCQFRRTSHVNRKNLSLNFVATSSFNSSFSES
jgi:hypothetical protein